ncbi:hypothetical protein P9112_005330 [Eukaryota sp. TZLM1-RC]
MQNSQLSSTYNSFPHCTSMGRHRKKRTHRKPTDEQYGEGVPRVLISEKGEVTRSLKHLITDLRQVFSPNTSKQLKVRKNNTLNDFLSVAGPLNISHLLFISQTEIAPYLRICRLHQGPTLTFRVNSFTLMRDVASFRTANNLPNAAGGTNYTNPPVLVMSGFSTGNIDSAALELMSTTFQQVLPPLDVSTVKLSQCKRVLLVHKTPDDQVEIRHYSIASTKPSSSRILSSLAKNSLPKNIGQVEDVAQILNDAGYQSEVEEEEKGKSRVKLVEIGPRLSCSLYKVEEGVCEGGVLFHEYQSKSAEEVQELKEKEQIRKQRKREMEKVRQKRREEAERKVHEEKEKAKEERRKEMKESEKDEGEEVGSKRRRGGKGGKEKRSR